jgi:S1-C subfamily serine protease
MAACVRTPAGAQPSEAPPSPAAASLSAPGDVGDPHRPIPPAVSPAAAAATATTDADAALAQAPDFRRVIHDAKARVFPAVVYVKAVQENLEAGAARTQEVTGSGVVISAAGLTLTNWHVVNKAVAVRCLLSDGRAFDAKVLGSDKSIDVALLDLKTDGASLPFAELGDSDALTEGSFVMAMGAPWGLNRSISMGIISCTRRYLPDTSEYSLWLQTDAAISPGNSGGPLVNTEGQVVGINTRGIMWGGDMGFALPANTIRQLLPQLRDGEVKWSWSGLQLQALRDFNRNIYFDALEGAIVAGTDPQSPASHAGLVVRDRITRVDGRPLTAMTEEDLPDIRRRLGLLPADRPVTLTVVRDGREMQISLTPRQKGEVEGATFDASRWDFTVRGINQFDNPQLFFHRQRGVFIFGVEYPGNAATAGLQPQDIVLKIDAGAIDDLEQFQTAYEQAVKQIDRTHRVRITVLRNGLLRQVVLNFARDYDKE